MKYIRFVVLFLFLVACSPASTSTGSSIPEELSPTVAPVQSQTPTSTLLPTLTPKPNGGGSGRIAFTSGQDGEQGIHVINSDGSNLVELAGDIPSKFNPDWFYDGTKLSFFSATEKSASLYTLDADGSNLVKVLDISEMSAYDQINPDSVFGIGCCSSAWSPDGEKIIFKTSREVGRFGSVGHIHVINLTNNQMYDFQAATWARFFWSSDGSKFGVIGTDRCGGRWLCIMNTADGIPVDLKDIYSVTFPSYMYWSPDEKKITFAGFWNSKNTDVFVMDADFSNPINVSPSLVTGQNDNPVWSPDSQKIAFTSCDVYQCELYVVNANGSNLVKLKTWTLGLYNIVWSHDGRKIVYVSEENGNSDIYLANVDGSETINLTDHPSEDSDPIWSPDGTKLAFVSNREGDSDIYILDPETMDLFNLTNNDVDDHSPVWQP